MELKCLSKYMEPGLTLEAGDTTKGRELTDEHKQSILADFPLWFEVIEEADEEAEPAAEETPKKGPGKKKA